MSSEIKADKWSPASGTSGTIGDSGDTFTVPSGVTLDVASGATADFTGATVTGLTDNNTWVQVAKVVNSSVGAASVEVQNCFTTTYKLYMIVCRMFRPSTDNDYCRMRLMTGTNTAVTASNYRRANTMFRSNNTTDTSYGDSDEFRIMEGVEDAAAESGGMFIMYASIDRGTSSSCSFKFTGTSSYTEGNASSKIQSTGNIGGFYFDAISSVDPTGFLLRSANNITEVDVTVFGMVQS